MVCFNECLLKATGSIYGRYRCSLTVILGLVQKGKTVNRSYQGVITANVSMEIYATFGEIKL